MITEQIKKLLVNAVQSFSEAEKLQGRTNIDAAKNALATQSDNGLMSASDKTKLDNVQAGAEVNVQSDWAQTNTNEDDYIKNKPNFFIAQYGVTTYAEVLAAFDAGLNILCFKPYSSPASYRSWMLGILGFAYIDDSITLASRSFEFAYFKPKNRDNQATTSNQGIAEIETWKVHGNDSWESASKPVAPLIAAGTGMSTSYSASLRKVTIGVTSAISTGAAAGSTAVQPGDLATVATSGSWNDLSDKPTIPDPQVQSDWTATSGIAQILNKPEIGYKSYGDTSVTEATSLVVDGDEPNGTTDVKVNGSSKGSLISGPYKVLLDSGVNGLGDSSEGVYIDSNGVFQKCAKNVVYIGLDTSYADVLAHVNANREVILRVWPTEGSQLFQDFRLMQYNPDGSMEFTCVTSGNSSIYAYKYVLQSGGVWQRTDTGAKSYTGIQIDGIGRNLHLNQNNYVQTNFPGGLWTVDVAQGNSFHRLDNGGFAGAYNLAVRYNTDGTYELGISYFASGFSSTITFIGTETIVALDNSMTTKQAVYINETVRYTVSSKFGGSASTAFNPNSHKAIIYSGFANIGPASDTKIAIWEDSGAVKIGMTSIEVGKVGATN